MTSNDDNDDVLGRANDLFSSMKPSELVNKAMAEMVARESSRRLADFLGTEPNASALSRRDSYLLEGEIAYNSKKQ